MSFPNFLYTPSQNFFDAMQRMGIPAQTDPANPPQKGAMFLPQGISPWNQSRADARRMRWDPVQDRPNFWISTGQHVLRVLFEGGCAQPGPDGARAVGVEVKDIVGNPIWTAQATREVILSAGAIRTPQTLELSGIGDTNVLNGIGLQTRIGLPGVGNNLQDHMLMHMAQSFNNESYVYSNILNNATINDAARQLYYENRTGPYTFGPPDGDGFLSLPQFSDRAQDLQAQAQAQGDGDYLAPGLDPTVVAGFAAQRALLAPALGDVNRGAIEFLQDNAGNTQISNQRPLTRGTVHAVNQDAFTYPSLDFRYCANPVDRAVMFDALRWNDDLFQQPEIQIMEPQQIVPSHGGSDDEFNGFLDNSLGTEFHPSCTAAMMPRDQGGVVDPNLLVYGTQNLRIVDASIFPIIPAAHLEAVVYGVAEKAADIIRGAQGANPPRPPVVPLDQTQCTTGAPQKRDIGNPKNYPEHHFLSRRQQPTPTEDNPGTPSAIGLYPDYGVQPAYRAPAPLASASGRVMEPASKGMPTGAGLDFGNLLVGGVNGTVGGVLNGLRQGVGNLVGDYNGSPPRY